MHNNNYNTPQRPLGTRGARGHYVRAAAHDGPSSAVPSALRSDSISSDSPDPERRDCVAPGGAHNGPRPRPAYANGDGSAAASSSSSAYVGRGGMHSAAGGRYSAAGGMHSAAGGRYRGQASDGRMGAGKGRLRFGDGAWPYLPIDNITTSTCAQQFTKLSLKSRLEKLESFCIELYLLLHMDVKEFWTTLADDTSVLLFLDSYIHFVTRPHDADFAAQPSCKMTTLRLPYRYDKAAADIKLLCALLIHRLFDTNEVVRQYGSWQQYDRAWRQGHDPAGPCTAAYSLMSYSKLLAAAVVFGTNPTTLPIIAGAIESAIQNLTHLQNDGPKCLQDVVTALWRENYKLADGVALRDGNQRWLELEARCNVITDLLVSVSAFFKVFPRVVICAVCPPVKLNCRSPEMMEVTQSIFRNLYASDVYCIPDTDVDSSAVVAVNLCRVSAAGLLVILAEYHFISNLASGTNEQKAQRLVDWLEQLAALIIYGWTNEKMEEDMDPESSSAAAGGGVVLDSSTVPHCAQLALELGGVRRLLDTEWNVLISQSPTKADKIAIIDELLPPTSWKLEVPTGTTGVEIWSCEVTAADAVASEEHVGQVEEILGVQVHSRQEIRTALKKTDGNVDEAILSLTSSSTAGRFTVPYARPRSHMLPPVADKMLKQQILEYAAKDEVDRHTEWAIEEDALGDNYYKQTYNDSDGDAVADGGSDTDVPDATKQPTNKTAGGRRAEDKTAAQQQSSTGRGRGSRYHRKDRHTQKLSKGMI